MRDPEDTIPPRPSEPSRPPPPMTLEERGARLVDAYASTLATWCAGWALRGYAVEDLVGVIHDCHCCRAIVFPRAELGRRYAPGAVEREALASAGSRRGRLAVAALTQDGCATYHPSIPSVLDARDTRGLVAPLPAARRQWLDDWVGREGHFIRRSIQKEVLACGLRIDHVVVVRSIALGNWRAWPRGDFLIREHEPFVEAARFAAIPYHVMFLFEPAEGDGYAVAWVAPERLGFQGADLDRLLCREHRGPYAEAREVGA